MSAGAKLLHGLGRAALALLCASCSSGERGAAAELHVFCAASAVDFVERAAAEFDAARVVVVVGPTSGLARQISDGAPADLFVAASREWVSWLAERSRLAGEPAVLARNRLVCATARRSALAAAPPRNLHELLDGLAPDERIAITDEGVPAGRYARASLVTNGALERARPHLVGQADVRAVARAVESGEASAGFVYATDARAAELTTLFVLDPQSHGPIELFGATVFQEPSIQEPSIQEPRFELAARLLAHLGSDRSREILDELGFEQVDP